MHTGSAPDAAPRSAAPPWSNRGFSADSDVPVAPGEALSGRYLIEGILGEGGMGVVCLGRHIDLDQPVAVKFLKRALATQPTVVQRFLNEGRAAAALRSPHVVRVMDVGQLETGQPYLVMERLEGIDLDALVERDGPLDVHRAVGFAVEACEALAEAHGAGIIHRDIKPENLFLSLTGEGRGTVKIVDFVLAKRLDGAQRNVVTGPQDGMGSPCYMSPEQIVSARTVDGRTDIWSMGVVLYYLLSGKLPFEGESITQVCARVLNTIPTPLAELCPGLPPELARIVGRCLQKSPGLRYPNVQELARDLRSFRTTLNGDSFARTVAARELRVPRRRRWLAPAASVALLLGLTALGVSRRPDLVARWTPAWLSTPRLAPADDVPVTRSLDVPLVLATSMAASTAEPEVVSGLDVVLTDDEASPSARPPSAHAARASSKTSTAAPPAPEPPLTPEEIERRRVQYQRYLKQRGLTPLRDVLQGLEQKH